MNSNIGKIISDNSDNFVNILNTKFVKILRVAWKFCIIYVTNHFLNNLAEDK